MIFVSLFYGELVRLLLTHSHYSNNIMKVIKDGD